MPLSISPQVASNSPAGGNTQLPSVPPLASGSRIAARQAIATGGVPSSPAVSAARLSIPAADRFVGASLARGSAGDLAWLGQALQGWDASNQQHKKDLATRALEAVFAQYGR